MKYRINKFYNKDKSLIRYYLSYSIRDGKKVSTKNAIFLGTNISLSKEYNDVEAYVQKRLEEENTKLLEDDIDKMSPLVVSKTLQRNKRVKLNSNTKLYTGTIYIKRILDAVKFDECLNKIKDNSNIKYDLVDAIYSLTSWRVIRPSSKSRMFETFINQDIIEHSISKHHIYRAMKVLETNKSIILKHLYEHCFPKIERDNTILYYDCTNTYFESDIEDELRHTGKGKRNELEPLVNLGLALDGNGIPLTFTVFRGGLSEQKTLIPLEQQIGKDFKNADFIVCTDAGLSSKENRSFNSLNHRKFITTLPVRKMSQEKLNLYVFDNKIAWSSPAEKYDTPEKIIAEYKRVTSEEYLNSVKNSNKYSSDLDALINLKIFKRHKVLIDKFSKQFLTSNQKQEIIRAKKLRKESPLEYIEEDYIISFSLSYYLREQKRRNLLIDKAKKCINKNGKLKKNYKSTDPHSLLKQQSVNITTGEVDDLFVELDLNKIEEQEKLDGYYCVATNAFDLDNEKIISIMQYRWFIEDSFEIMKQFYDFRPVRHWTTKMIKAHFFSCFIVLLVHRYIQLYCHNSSYESLKNITDEQIIDILRGCFLLSTQNVYEPVYDNLTKQVQDFEDLFSVNLNKEVMLKADVNKEIRKKLKI